MEKNRLEAFSDGVLAIIITIMVLELKVPHGDDFDALLPIVPTLLSYILSFVYVGIYWNNHHHMLQTIRRVNGLVLWANLHLLFWLSLLPFATGWMGENHFARWPTFVYGVVLFGAAVAYYVLQTSLVAAQGRNGPLARAIGRDLKGKTSPIFYILGLAGAGLDFAWIGTAFFVAVALMWLVPDKRIERMLSEEAPRG